MEVIGPAGAGKTSLARALSDERLEFQVGIEISRAMQIPFVAISTAPLLPIFLRQYRSSRWFSRREARSMAYLKAWLNVLGREGESEDGRVIILDHGPLYRLAQLREFGPDIRNSQRYRRWWSRVFHEWATTLDLLVWLDAPDSVLLERIRVRADPHSIKNKSEREAREFLRDYRGALERIADEAVQVHRLTLLRFDSEREPVAEIAERVLGTLAPDAMRGARTTTRTLAAG